MPKHSPRSKTQPPVKKNKRRTSVLLALGWYSAGIHRGITRYAREAGWVLDLTLTRNRLSPEIPQGDGIISLLRHEEVDFHEAIRKTKLPIVDISDAPMRGAVTVRADNKVIGRMAAEHFLERGFRDMAFFLPTETLGGRERCDAFRAEATRGGARFHLLDWSAHDKNYQQKARSTMITWLARELAKLPKPIAIFAKHDEAGIAVLQACQWANIPVPEQAAVLGVDNDAMQCEFTSVPLSSIDNNQEMEGYEAARQLDRLMKGLPAPKKTVLVQPIGVVTRLSSDILAVKHPHVASALLHIWQNYTKPINVKTVVATVPISYRWLHKAFLENIGRTIAEEITLKRLEKAKQLLADTDMNLKEIAEACGFPGSIRVVRVFRRELGTTPMEWRRRNRRNASGGLSGAAASGRGNV